MNETLAQRAHPEMGALLA
ncbi:hypothetical protein A2U01_0091444, partial [Trifolium medium]|nr:hypothetical protein [Trifolium medium]